MVRRAAPRSKAATALVGALVLAGAALPASSPAATKGKTKTKTSVVRRSLPAPGAIELVAARQHVARGRRGSSRLALSVRGAPAGAVVLSADLVPSSSKRNTALNRDRFELLAVIRAARGAAGGPLTLKPPAAVTKRGRVTASSMLLLPAGERPPLRRTLFRSLVGSRAATFVASRLTGFGVLAPPASTTPAVAAAVRTVYELIFRYSSATLTPSERQALLWQIEAALRLDIDGDGRIGPPPAPPTVPAPAPAAPAPFQLSPGVHQAFGNFTSASGGCPGGQPFQEIYDFQTPAPGTLSLRRQSTPTALTGAIAPDGSFAVSSATESYSGRISGQAFNATGTRTSGGCTESYSGAFELDPFFGAISYAGTTSQSNILLSVHDNEPAGTPAVTQVTLEFTGGESVTAASVNGASCGAQGSFVAVCPVNLPPGGDLRMSVQLDRAMPAGEGAFLLVKRSDTSQPAGLQMNGP